LHSWFFQLSDTVSLKEREAELRRREEEAAKEEDRKARCEILNWYTVQYVKPLNCLFLHKSFIARVRRRILQQNCFKSYVVPDFRSNYLNKNFLISDTFLRFCPLCFDIGYRKLTHMFSPISDVRLSSLIRNVSEVNKRLGVKFSGCSSRIRIFSIPDPHQRI